MKTFIISLMSACILSLSVSAQRTTPQNQDELKRISTMIVQGKPSTEVLKAWEALIRRDPKIDIDKAIETIISTAQQENKRVNTGLETYRNTESVITNIGKQMHETAKKTLENLKG